MPQGKDSREFWGTGSEIFGMLQVKLSGLLTLIVISR